MGFMQSSLSREDVLFAGAASSFGASLTTERHSGSCDPFRVGPAVPRHFAFGTHLSCGFGSFLCRLFCFCSHNSLLHFFDCVNVANFKICFSVPPSTADIHSE